MYKSANCVASVSSDEIEKFHLRFQRDSLTHDKETKLPEAKGFGKFYVSSELMAFAGLNIAWLLIYIVI